MSEISSDGIVVPLHPEVDDLRALRAENARLHDALKTRIVIEQAKGAVSARQGTTPEIAFEMLRGLARSQGRHLHEYAAAVVESGGRLDA